MAGTSHPGFPVGPVRSWLGAILLLLAATLSQSCGQQGSLAMDLVVIPSLKGEIFPRIADARKQGGLGLVGGILDSLRIKRSDLVVCAANNTLSGSPEAYFSQGEVVVQGLDALSTDALFLEAREFAFGAPRVHTLSRQSPMPFVAANLRDTGGSGGQWFHPWYYNPSQGLLLIGLVGPFFQTKVREEFIRGYEQVDALEEVRRILDHLPPLDPAPRTIGVLALGYRALEDGKGYLWDIARVPGIDFVVQGAVDPIPSGICTRPGGALDTRQGQLVKADQDGLVILLNAPQSDLGHQLLQVAGGRETGFQFKIHEVDDAHAQPAPGLKDFLYRARVVLESMLEETLATIQGPFTHRDDGESPLGDLVCDLMRRHGASQVAFINSGALRKGFLSDPVKLRHVYDMLPFGGNLVQGEIQGRDLLAVLAHSATFLGHPEEGRGFLQLSGIEVEFRQGSSGEWTLEPDSVRVGATALSPDSWYSFTSEAFLFSGGDGYGFFKASRNVRVSSQDIISQMRTWIQDTGHLDLPEGSRIRLRPWEGTALP